MFDLIKPGLITKRGPALTKMTLSLRRGEKDGHYNLQIKGLTNKCEALVQT